MSPRIATPPARCLHLSTRLLLLLLLLLLRLLLLRRRRLRRLLLLQLWLLLLLLRRMRRLLSMLHRPLRPPPHQHVEHALQPVSNRVAGRPEGCWVGARDRLSAAFTSRGRERVGAGRHAGQHGREAQPRV